MSEKKTKKSQIEELNSIIFALVLLFFGFLFWYTKDILGNIIYMEGIFVFLFEIFILMIAALIYLRNQIPLDEDEVQRASAAEIDKTEKRILSSVDNMIQSALKIRFKNVDLFPPSIKEKISDDFISTIDEKLRERITTEAKPIRLLSYL